MSSQILCCPLERSINIRNPTKLGKNRIAGVKSVRSYRDYDGINGEPTELEWNIFPGFTTLQLCCKVNDLLSDLGQTPETFTGRILFMSTFNDISCDRKGNKEECLANARVVKVLAKKFGIGVKSIHPTTENWLRKHYKYSKKNYKSTEDKHETNHINNKYNDMNMNTRKMHNT